MSKIVASALFFVVMSVAAEPWAKTFKGHVIAVADGETITVISAKHQQLRVRLAGIDAPERQQPFARQSRENLSRWVRRKEVVVEWDQKDRYGRLIGIVLLDGREINLEQLRAGYAWWYREHTRELTPEAQRRYETAEQEARTRNRGLWQQENPVPPWEWRRIP